MAETFRFYIGGVDNGARRHANLVKLANELFDGNKSALINYALNKTFGLDPLTGERLPDAPQYARQTDELFLLNDGPRIPKGKKSKD